MSTVLVLARIAAGFLLWTGALFFYGEPLSRWASVWRDLDGPGRVIFFYVPLAIFAQWFLQGTSLADVLRFILPTGRPRNTGRPARKAGRKFAKPPVVETPENPVQDAPRELSDDLRDYLNEAYNQHLNKR